MKLLIVLILVLVVITGIGVYFVFFHSSLPAGQNENGQQVTFAGPSGLHVVGQQEGTSVIISELVLENGGFVVIHEDANGAPGTILGATPFLPAGRAQNIPVFLARKTQNNEILYAMLYADNRDARFNASDDAPIRDQQGNIIMQSFSISPSGQNPQP